MTRFIIIAYFICFCYFSHKAITIEHGHWTDYAIPIVFAVIVVYHYVAYRQEKERIKRRAKLFDELLKNRTTEL
jgi:ABC-type Co2+ transport system permease subunit